MSDAAFPVRRSIKETVLVNARPHAYMKAIKGIRNVGVLG